MLIHCEIRDVLMFYNNNKRKIIDCDKSKVDENRQLRQMN